MEAPTIGLCDCPNGCVVLRFGYITAHLPRAAFVVFARRVIAVAHALERGADAYSEH